MKKRKICALVVSCAMLVSLLPTTIFAEGDDEETTTDAVEITEAEPEEEASDSADVVIGGGGSVSLVTEDEEPESGEDADEAEPEEEPEDEEDIVYQAESGSVRVEVTAPADALPEDAKLSVERYAKDSANYRDAAEAIDLDEGSDMAALDISFLVDGEEVEPSEPVKVSIDVSDILPEDADASTLEVQHLKEGRGGQTKAEVVANDSGETEGTIDEEEATAEFEVDSFSTFTVTWTWSGQTGTESSTSLTMTVYIDNVEINDIDDITFTSEDHELNLEDFLYENNYGTGDYTFLYATASGTRSGQGGGSTTLGSETNPVVSISKTAGPNSTFEVTTLDGTTTTMTNTNLVITAYYETPTFSVDISAVGADAEEDWLLQAILSHAGTYDHVDYIWTVTSVDESGNDTGDISTAATAEDYGSGRALITWSDDVEDDHTVMVHVTVNLYDENNELIGTATASYKLEYSDETIDIDVTYGPDGASVGAGVTVTIVNTADAQYTYTGTTDESGRVEFEGVHPGTYTVTTTDYTDANGNTYACDSNETLNLHEPGNYEVNLKYQISDDEKTYIPEKDDWNHIDIKLTLGSSSTADANSVTSFDIVKVQIIGADGTVRYTSGDIDKQNDVEFQIYFNEGNDDSGTGGSHTINFSSTDIIYIVYTETWTDSDGNEQTDQYEIYITPESTYPEGTTYPADGARAYKLYNYLYNTSYTSNAELMAAGVTSIDVSGMGMMTVAAILCDSSTVNSAGTMSGTAGMWGMDFALSLEAMASLNTNWAFEIEKTLENISMDAGTFGFFLYDATVSDGVWTIADTVGDYEQGFTNAGKGKDLDGNSRDTMTSSTIAYTDEEIRSGDSIYYILYEYKGGTTETYKDGILSYDETVYGVKIDFDIDEDEGVASVNATYYLLTSNGSGGYTISSEASVGTNSSGYPVFQFTNTYTTDVTLLKTDEYGNNLDAQFTLTQEVIDSTTEETRNCYYDPTNASGPWIDYDPNSTETTFPSFTLGTIELDTPYDGTYTLTEVKAADGYGTLPGAITFEVSDGEIVENSVKWADSSTEADISDYATLTGGLLLTITDPDTTTQVTVTKEWEDSNNQDGKRPTSIEVQLTADGEAYGDSVTLTEDYEGNWTYTWTDLPVHNSSGSEVKYSVEEPTVPEGYTSAVDEDGTAYTITVTNTYTPETVNVKGSKTWEDANNQDGKRPSSITIRLFAGEEEVDSVTVTAEDGWEWSFTNLPKYANGTEITYTITEDTVDGYTTTYDDYDVINSHTPETIDISGSKTWDDADDQDGKRPESITIHLFAGEDEVDSATVTATDNWAWSFTDLPKYADGVEITYTITEDAVTDYDTTINGYDVTNSYTPETVDVKGSKTWDDANNQDGKRPTSITVNLLADGNVIESKTVTAADGWEWSFTGLDKYRDGGIEIVYTITEDEVEGYTTEVDGYDVTNSYTPEKTTVEGTKTWEDNDNQDGVRPESITVRLYADGTEIKSVTVTEEDEWSWSFTDLDKYRDGGVEILYTVTEDFITTSDYSAEISGYDITNTHTPAKTSLHVQKFWQDDDDQDGVRPGSIEVTLTADGVETNQTLILTEDNGWSGNFTGLDKYKDGGTEIQYSISENIEGYKYVTTVTDVEGTATVYITNEHISATTEISGSKIWDDADDQDGIRPKEITVRLMADGEAALDENSDPITATVTADDNWSFIFTNLPKYHDHGAEIVYTVAEAEIEGYETSIDGTVITNTHTPETIDIPVEKVWEDDDNEYNHRPDSIEVELVVNGEETDTKLTLSEANDWSDTFTDLDKYENGEEITYTVKELSDEALQYYTPKTTYNDDGSVTIVNQREYFDIDEEIVVDEDDRDTWVKREAVNEYNAIEFEMSTYLPVIETDELGNGDFTMNFHEVLDSELNLDEADADFTVTIAGYKISHDYYTVEISPDDGCSFHVDVDLTALYIDGIVTEDMLDGNTEIMIFFFADLEGTGLNGSYTSTVWYEVYDGDDLQYISSVDVVAVYTYEIEINKYDEDTEKKLAGATFGVYYDEACTDPVMRSTDGEEAQPYTTVSDEDGSAMFYGLADGTYYVQELQAPDGYVLDDTPIEVELGEDLNDQEYTYTIDFPNTAETCDISGSKTWDDDNDKADARPASITVNLYQNDELYKSETVTAADGWAWSWSDLPKYDEDGNAYAYTIDEDAVEYYTPTYFEGSFDITNTFIGEEGAEQPPTSGPEKGGDTPKTGDTNNLGIWLALLIAALTCALVGFRMRRRTQK